MVRKDGERLTRRVWSCTSFLIFKAKYVSKNLRKPSYSYSYRFTKEIDSGSIGREYNIRESSVARISKEIIMTIRSLRDVVI